MLEKKLLWLKNNFALSFTFFIGTSIYFFSAIFFGLDFTDSFYHLNQALNPADDIYLYPFFFSSIIIKMLVQNMGPEIIYLRMLNSGLLYFSLFIPFFINGIKILKPKILYIISIVLILFAPFNVNILGYDSLSIFILSIIFSVTVYYLNKPNFHLLLLLSFLSAVAILIRIPNILVVPILLIAIGLTFKNNSDFYSGHKALILLGFLFFTFLIVFVGYFTYYPGFEKFTQASANATSHEFVSLLKNYLRDGTQIILFIILILGGFFMIEKNRKFHKILILVLTGIFFFSFFAEFIAFSKYSQKYSFLLTALAISLILVHFFHSRNSPFNLKKIILFLFLMFLLVNPFGSNTGLLKAASLVVLVPFVLNITNFHFNKYWLLFFTILIPFSLLENFYKTYEDQGVLRLNKRLKLELLSPIYTTEVRGEFLENINLEVKRLKKNNIKVFFYGDKSHLFHYLYPGTALNVNNFYQPIDDLIYYPNIKQEIKNKANVAIFLIGSYPEGELNSQSVLGTELINNGFTKVTVKSTPYYFYYLKSAY